MKMTLKNLRGEDAELTTVHAMADHSPVLIVAGTAYLPSDIMGDTRAYRVVRSWLNWARDMVTPAEYDFVERFCGNIE